MIETGFWRLAGRAFPRVVGVRAGRTGDGVGPGRRSGPRRERGAGVASVYPPVTAPRSLIERISVEVAPGTSTITARLTAYGAEAAPARVPKGTNGPSRSRRRVDGRLTRIPLTSLG